MSRVPRGSIWRVLLTSLALGGWGGLGLGCSGPGAVAAADASTSDQPAADDRNDGVDAWPSADDASDLDVPSVDASADVPPGGGGLWWAIAPANDVAGAATLDTLAIAYVEATAGSSASPEGRLVLQLLDGQLQPRGGLTEIDRQPIAEGAPPIASVATDGNGFVVCWSPTDQLRCLEPGAGPGASLLFQTAGTWPTIAFQGTAWAVAYVTSPGRSQTGEVRVTTFSRQGVALATSASLPYDALGGGRQRAGSGADFAFS